MNGPNSEYAQYVKEQLNNEQWERLEKIEKTLDKEIQLDETRLYEIMCDFSDREKRIAAETPFIMSQVADIKTKKIFDASLGSGYASLGLKRAGVAHVTSNDIDENLIQHSLKEAAEMNLSLTITRYDWRELDQHFSNEFDVVFNLGNSLTYLFKPSDRKKSVENFFAITKPEGTLLIDTRNYQEIISGNFQNKGRGVYKGTDKIHIKPAYVAQDMIVMRYIHNASKNYYDLVLYPLMVEELSDLVRDAGFRNIKIFGDYKEKYTPKEVEFYTVVAKK